MALQLARDNALVLGDHEGRHLHPERFSRTFHAELARARKALGEAISTRADRGGAGPRCSARGMAVGAE
jgi:hypothetical protein